MPYPTTLSRKARHAAKARGHELAPFGQTRLWPDHPVWSTQCIHCHAFATINPAPYPNEIDIGGKAVAVNCPRLPVLNF